MFTGIIQHTGRVVAVEAVDYGRRLSVDLHGWRHKPAAGESIAVNGCCLTVAGVSDGIARFDIIQQTLRVTALGSIMAGTPVNLEHAVSPVTLLGGHIVQGHVDGVGRIAGVVRSAQEYRLRIEPSTGAMCTIIEKGSIAVSGVSLTVAAVGPDWFEVALIPTTLQLTNLAMLRVGDEVNLEFDYIAKIVCNWLERQSIDSLVERVR